MPDNPFYEWLNLQRALQTEAFVEPSTLPDDEKPGFLLWNAFAAEDELHEAMQEVGWKPWATSTHLNREEFIGEIVDALHFIGNMLLTVTPYKEHEVIIRGQDPIIDVRPDLLALAREVWEAYQRKVQVNLQRQREGYTGLDKCPECHRELVGDPSGEGSYCPQHPNQEG